MMLCLKGFLSLGVDFLDLFGVDFFTLMLVYFSEGENVNSRAFLSALLKFSFDCCGILYSMLSTQCLIGN